MVVAVTTASVQDRDGGRTVLDRLRFTMPSMVTVFADGGYAGRLVVHARQFLRIAVELVKKPADQKAWSCRAAGWSNAPSPGWCAAAGSTTTTNACPPPPKPWSNGP